MNTSLGRTECAILQNKSGGNLVQGDVVIVDSVNADAVTTTTIAGYSSGRIGVVLEINGILANNYGLIAFSGYVPKINLSGAGNVGDLVKTNTVAKQAVRHAAPFVTGDFAQVLGTSATPSALLFGVPAISNASGNVFPVIETLDRLASGTLTTTSSSYADVDGANAEITIDKQFADTDILITLSVNFYTTVSNTAVQFAILNGGTDYSTVLRYQNTANVWTELYRTLKITGLADGSQTFRLRWKRYAGSGTLSLTAAEGSYRMTVQEVSA